MGAFLSFYFYFFKEKIQTSAFAEFTESFLQYLIGLYDITYFKLFNPLII